jgi:lysozyme
MALGVTEQTLVWDLLIKHEGNRQFPYFDCCSKPFKECQCENQGKLTIGVGRNIEDIGISESEAFALLMNDITRVNMQVENHFPWFKKLSPPRKSVVLSMVFNMGIEKFKEFKKMIGSLEQGHYSDASKQMLNSIWASQVKKRAIELSDIMESG